VVPVPFIGGSGQKLAGFTGYVGPAARASGMAEKTPTLTPKLLQGN